MEISVHATTTIMAETFAVFNAANAVRRTATSINNSSGGEVAGNFTDASQNVRGFLRHRDTEHGGFDTPTASGTAVFFSRINRQFRDVLPATSRVRQFTAFVRYHNGNVTAFDIPIGCSMPQVVNDGGEIAGLFQDASRAVRRAGFLRDKDWERRRFRCSLDVHYSHRIDQGEIAGRLADSSQFLKSAAAFASPQWEPPSMSPMR